MMATHTQAQMDYALETIEKVANELGVFAMK
jgi:hypothetical protein